MPLYKLVNTMSAAQVIYDSRGKTVTIPPKGEKNNVDLTDKGRDRLKRITKGLTITEQEIGFERAPRQESLSSGTERTAQTGDGGSSGAESQSGTGGSSGIESQSGTGGSSGETEEPSKKNRATQAAKLLADYRDKKMEYPEFVSKAKAMFGEDWPGGTPKKSIVISLLENVSE